MKKILYTMAFVLCALSAKAETIIVIDDNGYVKQQMTTTQNTVVQPVVQQVVTTQPAVTVVRESYSTPNSYYYDNISTGSAILAGVTTAVVGTLLFDGFRHHHKSAPAKIIAPSIHGGGHGGGHGGSHGGGHGKSPSPKHR